MLTLANITKFIIWRVIAAYFWALIFLNILEISPSHHILRYAFDFKLWYIPGYATILFLSIWLKKKAKAESGWKLQFFIGYPLYLILYPFTTALTVVAILAFPITLAYYLQRASSWLWENINSAIVKFPIIILLVVFTCSISYFPNPYLYWVTLIYGVFVIVYSLLSVGSWLFSPLATVESIVYSTRRVLRWFYGKFLKNSVDEFYKDPSSSSSDSNIIYFLTRFYRYFYWVKKKLENKNIQKGLIFLGFTATFLFHLFLAVFSFALFYFILQEGATTTHLLGAPEGNFLNHWSSYTFYSVMVMISGSTNFTPVSLWSYVLSILEIFVGVAFLVITIIMFETFGISKGEEKISEIKSSIESSLASLGNHLFLITKKYILAEEPTFPSHDMLESFLSVKSLTPASAKDKKIWRGWINFLQGIDKITEESEKEKLEELYTSLTPDQRKDLIRDMSDRISIQPQEILDKIEEY